MSGDQKFRSNVTGEVDEGGMLNLHKATQRPKIFLKEVKNLVDRGVDINHQEENGNTPLMEVICNSRTKCSDKSDIVEFLISKGSNVDISNKKGESAVHLCCDFGNREIMRKLITAGANLNVPDNEGLHPIHKLKYVDLFVEAGADVNVMDSQGYSPLHLAVQDLKIDVIRDLEGSGCDVDSCNKRGLTPLLALASNKSSENDLVTEIADVLIRFGANVNARDKQGNTPLIMASKNFYPNLVLLLANAGADPNARNGFNRRALELTTHPDIVAFLISKKDESGASDVYKETVSLIPKLKTIIKDDPYLEKEEKLSGIEKINDLEKLLTKAIDIRAGVGVMTSQHKSILREHRLLLVEEISPQALFSHFIQERILTDNDVDEIKLEGTRRRMSEKLLDIIERRGDLAFRVLCESLSDNGQQYLVDTLQKPPHSPK